VPRGTDLKFTFDDGMEITGKFDGNIDHLQYHVFCPEILRNIDIYLEAEPLTEFIIGDKSYNFKSKLLRATEQKNALNESLELRVISPFKEVPLRKSFRIQIALKVRVHEYSDDFKKLYSNGWLIDAVSDDMSKNGICLWSDHLIDAPIGTMFTLEFALKHGKMYMVPSKLMRNQPNATTRSYNYEYGFVFDFTDMPELQEKLLLEILEFKIKNRL
jgi:hypothetical protein